MKKILFLTILFVTFLSSVKVNTAYADTAPRRCEYKNTQARVQKDINDPWKKSMKLSCGESFNVGSFHNNTGQFAQDTTITITGTDYLGNPFYQTASNGQKVTLPQYARGTYTVRVKTNGQKGSACQASARVQVHCNKPSYCQHDSTQARVQKDINNPWQNNLSLNCGETFRVGSFHNRVDRFADDTKITVYGKNKNNDIFYQNFNNGDTIQIPTQVRGDYKVYVGTNNQYGRDCRATARVKIRC